MHFIDVVMSTNIEVPMGYVREIGHSFNLLRPFVTLNDEEQVTYTYLRIVTFQDDIMPEEAAKFNSLPEDLRRNLSIDPAGIGPGDGIIFLERIMRSPKLIMNQSTSNNLRRTKPQNSKLLKQTGNLIGNIGSSTRKRSWNRLPSNMSLRKMRGLLQNTTPFSRKARSQS